MTEVSVRLNSGPPVILDGAMGTQLLDRGLDLKLPLWSAEILELSPKIIEEIHKDYINAGAEIITTNTFRTTTRTFRKVFQDNSNFSIVEIKEKNIPHSFINKNFLKSIA